MSLEKVVNRVEGEGINQPLPGNATIVVERLIYGIARSTAAGGILWCSGLLTERPWLHAHFPLWAVKALSALAAGDAIIPHVPAFLLARRAAEWLESHPLDDTDALRISVSREGGDLVWLVTDVQLCDSSRRSK